MDSLIEKKHSFLIHIGKKLKMLRLAGNIEIESASKALKISLKRLREIENGQRDVKLDLFVRICDFYEVDARSVLPKDQTFSRSR
jgi:transcriptional regulator with XRE-family HTH domain